MQIQPNPYFIPLVATLIAVVWVLLTVSKRRASSPGTVAFLALMAGVTEWTVCQIIQFFFADQATHFFWLKLRYIGVEMIPPVFLLFALDFTGHLGWLRWPRSLWLFVLPAILFILVWTTDSHGLFYYNPRMVLNNGLAYLALDKGPAFIVHMVYGEGLIFVAVFYLIRYCFQADNLYREQAITVTAGISIPFVFSVAHALGLNPLVGFDWTPFGFAIGGVFVVFSLTRYKLLDLGPIARDRVINSMQDALMVLDDQSRIVDANPAFEEVAGRKRSEFLGKTTLEAMSHLITSWQQFRGVEQAHGETSLPKDGELHYYEVTISPIRDRANHLKGRVVMLHDITDRKQVEKEMHRAKEAAEAANLAKSQFLASMSHELRTPLNAIIGYSEMLQEEALDSGLDFGGEELNRIQTASKHLLGLINDVLDLSKIEAGKMQMSLETFAVGPLLRDTETAIQPLMQKNQNQFELIVVNDLGAMYSDVLKVRQSLLNLLSNAAKFTHKGRVTLKAERFEQEGQPWLRLAVSDTGIGISAEQQTKLFQPFTQADSSTTRKYGGTGLGLSLTKRLCEMLGGEIQLESQLGQGSTFTILLPASASPPEPLEPETATTEIEPAPDPDPTPANEPAPVNY